MWLFFAAGVGLVVGLVIGDWMGNRGSAELYLTGMEMGIVEGRRQITALRRSADMRGRRA